MTCLVPKKCSCSTIADAAEPTTTACQYCGRFLKPGGRTVCICQQFCCIVLGRAYLLFVAWHGQTWHEQAIGLPNCWQFSGSFQLNCPLKVSHVWPGDLKTGSPVPWSPHSARGAGARSSTASPWRCLPTGRSGRASRRRAPGRMRAPARMRPRFFFFFFFFARLPLWFVSPLGEKRRQKKQTRVFQESGALK